MIGLPSLSNTGMYSGLLLVPIFSIFCLSSNPPENANDSLSCGPISGVSKLNKLKSVYPGARFAKNPGKAGFAAYCVVAAATAS